MRQAIILLGLLVSANIGESAEVILNPGSHPCEIRARITHPEWGTLGYLDLKDGDFKEVILGGLKQIAFEVGVDPKEVKKRFDELTKLCKGKMHGPEYRDPSFLQRVPPERAALAFPAGIFRPVNQWLVADFTGDGLADSLTLSSGSYALQARQANGTFPETAARRTLGPATGGWAAGAPADLNGDGRQDLILCCVNVATSPRLAVALGNGDGTFQTATESIAGSALLFAGDWDGDGRVDIVARAGDNVVIALGQAGGTFQVSRTAPVLGLAAILADATGDGRTDLVVMADASVVVFPGQAGGSLGGALTTDLLFDGARTMIAADYNADRKLDVAVFDTFRGAGTVLFGDQPGRFRTPGLFASMFFTTPWATDLDGDGTTELTLPGGFGGSLMVAPVRSDGRIAAPPLYRIPRQGQTLQLAPSAATVGEFTGDDRADIVAAANAAGTAHIAVYPGTPSILARAPLPILTIPQAGILKIEPADFNRDGRNDLAAIDNGGSRLILLTGDGRGGFAPAMTALPGRPVDLAVADFNGDGRPDVAVAGEAVHIFTSGAGGFQAFATSRPAGTVQKVAAGDFNADGRHDIAYLTFDGAGIVLNQGNGVFSAPAALELPPRFSLTAIASIDVNGDRRDDLIVAGIFSGAGPLRVLLSNGNGTFTAQPHQGTFDDEFVTSITAADLDRDGKTDLLMARCCGTNTATTYYYGNGDGTFSLARRLRTGENSSQAWLADTTGDGAAEIVALTEAGVSITPLPPENLRRVAAVSTASGLGPVAANSLVSAYGTQLAASAEAATAAGQTQISGVRVTVIDQNRRVAAAPLSFVSPGQINFLLPAGLAAGRAYVEISSDDGSIAEGDITIDRVAPGLLVLNAAGLVAANVIRVKPDGAQIAEDVFRVEGGQVVARSVSLGPEGETIVLVLYGTGIRGRTNLNAVSASIGGSAAPVAFAGPQGEFPGLDQVNLTIPRSLAGRGRVEVVLTVEGKQTNTAYIEVE